MDSHAFDKVARVFASGATRRLALRFLAVTSVAAWRPRQAGTAPARQGGECETGLTYCEEQTGWAPAGCYDLSSDYLHCGDCMYQCPSAGPVEMACAGWECVVIGCGDLIDCTGNLDCSDLSSDPNNCGACGNACDSGVCEAGACVAAETTCEAGFTYCPANDLEQPAGCYDLASDYTHCGACDQSCPVASPGPMACIDGLCQRHCDSPLTLCENPQSIHPFYCADFSSDPGNCGDCGMTCESGVCEGGTCV